MKKISYLIIIIFILSLNLSSAKDDDLQNKITKNLRCLICQGQSIYDSDSDFAISLKFLVKKNSMKVKTSNKFMIILKINMVIGFCMIQNLTKIPIFFGYYPS